VQQPELFHVQRCHIALVQIVDGGRQHRHQLHSLRAQSSLNNPRSDGLGSSNRSQNGLAAVSARDAT
jgi:hypothetical protein